MHESYPSEDSIGLQLCTRSDRDPTKPVLLRLDWSEEMRESEVPPLSWIHFYRTLMNLKKVLGTYHGQISKLYLEGDYHLTSGFLFGYIFNQPAGWHLLLEQHDMLWCSEITSQPKEGLLQEYWYNHPLETKTELLVGLAIARTKEEIITKISPLKMNFPTVILTQSSSGNRSELIRDGSKAMAMVQEVNRSMRKICSENHISKIHLFPATPKAFMVLLGWLWNANTPVQLYEYNKTLSSYYCAIDIQMLERLNDTHKE